MVRLLIDENLIGLGRRLRFFGFDVNIAPAGTADADLVAIARAQTRYVITRDREMAQIYPEILRIDHDDRDDQTIDVMRAVGVPPRAKWFTRCTLCNDELYALEAGEDPHHPAWRCPSCKRTYWMGSHFRRAVDDLTKVARAAGASTSIGRSGDEPRLEIAGRPESAD